MKHKNTKPLKRIENGEEITEHQACLPYHENAQTPSEAEKHGDGQGRAQLGGHVELLGGGSDGSPSEGAELVGN